MSQPATPWSNQPEGHPAEESGGETEHVLELRTFATRIVPYSPPTQPDLGSLIGTTIAILLVVLIGFLWTDNPTSAASSTAAPAAVDLGLIIGQVTANDGTTVTVHELLGATTKVHIDTGTKVLVFTGAGISDIEVGASVIVHGDKAADGSITANLILGAELR
ncbi:DUF5666 domain-containing protein [Nocardia sp. NBC_00565]|uniref:hypothetical protein n=1 Tax=Nocardia sp. NBC_00565 TaxID=2975993 RepID=UPI002E81723F|nr:hypothetical protein [Nocardia sp. NBC_00565]WUC04672.1 DUF5666 domain-containing protein [Nocardia sp. NBC_00565]